MLFESLDYVLAGTHHFHLKWVDSPDYTYSTTDVLFFAHRQLMGAINSPHVNALAHPWIGFQKYVKNYFSFAFDQIKLEWIEELGQTAKLNQTALEIPSWGLIRPDSTINQDYLDNFVRPLVKTGCAIMTGTDAHQLEAIGNGIERVTNILMEEGACIEQIWTPRNIVPEHPQKLAKKANS